MSIVNYRGVAIAGRDLVKDFGISATYCTSSYVRNARIVGNAVWMDYVGSDAISTRFDTLPIYSVICDYQANKIWYKTAAAGTWKYTAWT